MEVERREPPVGVNIRKWRKKYKQNPKLEARLNRFVEKETLEEVRIICLCAWNELDAFTNSVLICLMDGLPEKNATLLPISTNLFPVHSLSLPTLCHDI